MPAQSASRKKHCFSRASNNFIKKVVSSIKLEECWFPYPQLLTTDRISNNSYKDRVAAVFLPGMDAVKVVSISKVIILFWDLQMFKAQMEFMWARVSVLRHSKPCKLQVCFQTLHSQTDVSVLEQERRFSFVLLRKCGPLASEKFLLH